MKSIRLIISYLYLIILAGNNILVHSQTLPVDESEYNSKIRVACIGNSVTYGYGFKNRESDSYPAQLQKLLGEKYDVRNFGFNGATLLKKGHKPYWIQSQFTDALEFKPHIVIIHLGLNDTDPRNWPNYHDEFISDYEDLIKTFQRADIVPGPKVWICKMTPIFPWHSRFDTGTRDYFWAIQDAIQTVSKILNVSLIDLHTPLYHRTDLFRDAVHPSEEGALIIAETVKSAITGNYGGLSLPGIFSDHMVIQRGKPIVIRGKADAGQPVEVALSANKSKTTTGTDGKWKVELPAMDAGGPYSIVIKGEKTITIKDVLIGDIWVCSGQSNMAFKLKDSENAGTDILSANKSNLRLFNFNPVVTPSSGAYSKEILKKINEGDYFTQGPWEPCEPATAAGFSAVAYYFGRELHKELNVPIGLIHNAIGGSNTESWIWRKHLEFNSSTSVMLSDWLHNEHVQDWCRERATENLQNAINPLQRHPFEPGYLYEAGILPLIECPVKGIIWYQGESNAEKIEQHEILFRMLVDNWRSVWKDSIMPFIYVQLSSLNRETWPQFRDSQRRLSDQISNTGMTVTSDIGHPTDVHPKNKRDVGCRLARWALFLAYKKDIIPSGPLYKEIKITGNKIIVFFNYSTDRLKTSEGKTLRGFEISGQDGRFLEATAKISKDRVIVKNKNIKDPVDVRYAWKPFTDANLINSAGLPASTFTTEKTLYKRSGN